ncbi:MAG TPA: IS66 family transposase [Roseiarcus sp.]|nr:IS66 family transposase [Roseiarcus sp.]
MFERSDELPDDIDELKALTLANAARAEAEAQAARGEILKLKAEVSDLAETNAAAKVEIARLTSMLKSLQRGHFGKKSEKLGSDADEQQSFAFEEVETGLEEIGARLAAKAGAKPRNPSSGKPRFPSHLERVEEVVEPAIPPGFEDKERVKIGEDESFRLDVVRARFRLIVTIRPKYAFKEPAAILQAPAPEHIIEAGLPTEALLAQVAVSKYADGLPLYRQEAIYARDGVELSRSLMAQWMGAVGFHFEPLAAFVLGRIREGERIFADETTLPTLDPGAGKTKTAWLWAYARDDTPFGGAGPPMVAYRFEDSRSGDCVVRHLGDFRGILQCDGYAGYRKLAGVPRANGLRLAGCWAHLRRRFFDLHANGESVVASATVERMKLLWAVEQDVRGQSPDARQTARRATSAAIVQALFDLWERELPRISGKSKLAEAIRYARSHRAALLLFLDDGRVEIDSNIVERAIRPQTITRKNALFAGSIGGGRTWAAIATMFQTCKMNGVDPYAWAKLTLERIANRWPNRDIEALMPWNFKPLG